MSYIYFYVKELFIGTIGYFLWLIFWQNCPKIVAQLSLCLVIHSYIMLFRGFRGNIDTLNNFHLWYNIKYRLMMLIRNVDGRVIMAFGNWSIIEYFIAWLYFARIDWRSMIPNMSIAKLDVSDNSQVIGHLVNLGLNKKQLCSTDNIYNETKCPVCYDKMNTKSYVLLECKHLLCCQCFCMLYINYYNRYNCVLCKHKFEPTNCVYGDFL